MKPKGYNKNLIGGKRPHKGISAFKTSIDKDLSKLTLSERVMFEGKRLTNYRKRVGQHI